MNELPSIRVPPKQAARELGWSWMTLRHMMITGRVHLGDVVEHPEHRARKVELIIYRALLDREKAKRNLI